MNLLPQSERESAARLIERGGRLITGLQAAMAYRFLEINYRNYVNGTWRQGSRWVSRRHALAHTFHEACKALFCPVCRRCKRHHADAECTHAEGHDICWTPIGSAPVREEAGGEGEDAVRVCPLHGGVRWRQTMKYSTVALFTGNKACLAGETEVWTTEGYCRIDSIDGPVTVAAWNGERFAEADATALVIKGPDPLFRVMLASGRSFVATAAHRVMLANGSWRRVGHLRSGDGLRASDESRPRSIVDSAPSATSDNVVSVSFLRTDCHYDISVPGYENYLAGGVVQHNSKTSMAAAELFSWGMGYRPWDDTLTAPLGQGRIWAIVCQTLSTSGKLTIAPIINRYGGDRLKPEYNSSGGVSGWRVRRGPTAGDIFKLVSHDQHKNTKAEVSPVAGINPTGVLWDEPTNAAMRTEMTRGLAPAMSELNEGRELMSATLIDGAPEARAYMRNEVWDEAGNRGGKSREIFAIGGSIYDNPALTRETIRQIVAKWAPWERAARISGISGVDSGRLLPDFAVETHVYDDATYDFLTDLKTKEPTDHSIVLSVDPHLVRPWVMTWLMLCRHRDAVIWRVIREWPTRPFKELRHYRNAEDSFAGNFEAYAEVISRIEAGIPGGRQRIQWRFMDPAAGNTEVGGAGRTFAQAMSAFGYHFRTDDVPRDLEGGHHDLRKLMRGTWTPGKPVTETEFPFFMVARSCANSIWAPLNYVNDEHPNKQKTREVPMEAGKDQIDTWRWPVSMRLRPRSWLNPTPRMRIMQSTANNGLG